MIRRSLLSLPLIGAFLARTQAQTITACAPVFGKMPKPCNGQCPGCGLLHAPVIAQEVTQIEFPVIRYDNFALWPVKVLRDCSHCRAAFWQDVSE